jgi:uncharacterized OsmC-like protein
MIEIRAAVENRADAHRVTLETNGRAHELSIAPRAEGRGSRANGGELLFLALATCYCNDLHREAARRGMALGEVRVEVSGRFDAAPGSAAEGIAVDATVSAAASEAEILALMRETDAVAEVQNTLRRGTLVTLRRLVAIDTRAG